MALQTCNQMTFFEMKNMKSTDLITEAKSLICSSLLVAKLHHRPLADLHPPLVVRYGSFRLAFSQTHHHFSFLQEEFLSSTLGDRLNSEFRTHLFIKKC